MKKKSANSISDLGIKIALFSPLLSDSYSVFRWLIARASREREGPQKAQSFHFHSFATRTNTKTNTYKPNPSNVESSSWLDLNYMLSWFDSKFIVEIVWLIWGSRRLQQQQHRTNWKIVCIEIGLHHTVKIFTFCCCCAILITTPTTEWFIRMAVDDKDFCRRTKKYVRWAYGKRNPFRNHIGIISKYLSSF